MYLFQEFATFIFCNFHNPYHNFLLEFQLLRRTRVLVTKATPTEMVCGSNCKTYQNDCWLARDNCQLGTNHSMMIHAPCPRVMPVSVQSSFSFPILRQSLVCLTFESLCSNYLPQSCLILIAVSKTASKDKSYKIVGSVSSVQQLFKFYSSPISQFSRWSRVMLRSKRDTTCFQNVTLCPFLLPLISGSKSIR